MTKIIVKLKMFFQTILFLRHNRKCAINVFLNIYTYLCVCVFNIIVNTKMDKIITFLFLVTTLQAKNAIL